MADQDKTPGPENNLIRKIGLDSISSFPAVRATIVVILVLIIAYLLIGLIQALAFLFFLVVVSIFFAYLMDPLVRVIRRPFVVRQLDKLMPRPLAILVSYVFVFSVLALLIAYLAPRVTAQITEFVANAPRYTQAIQSRIDAFNNSYSELMVTEDVQREINTYISSSIKSLTETITSVAGSVVVTLLTYLPWLLLIPILGFFFLKDAALFRSMFLACFPPGRWRARIESLVTDINSTLAAYTRAQLISCVLIGSVCTLGFTVIGLDYALLLGLLAGIFEFVPLLGPLIIGVTATLVGGFSQNPWQGLWVAGFLIILRFTHDYFTYPRIVRDGIHLHPFAVILSILAGEQIAGVAGVILSIPFIALVTVFHKHIVEHSGGRGIFATIFRQDPAQVTPDEANE